MTATVRVAPTLLPEVDDATRREFLIGVGSLLVLAPYGCSGEDSGEGGQTDPDDTRKVVDASGAEIEIPKTPQRIAAAGERVFTEMLVAFGTQPTVAASIDEFPPFLVEALGGTEEIADLGPQSEVNLEELAAANPDLIIVQSVDNFGDEGLLENARQVAPTIQMNAYAGVREVITDFGAVFGEDRAEELQEQVDNQVERIASAVEDPGSVEVSSIFLRPHTFEVLTLDDTRLHAWMLQEAGYAIPEKQQKLDVDNELSLERLELADADVLFMVGFFGESDEQLKQIRSSELWQNLDAVENGAVIEGDFRYWSIGGPLSAEQVADDIVAGFRQIEFEN